MHCAVARIGFSALGTKRTGDKGDGQRGGENPLTAVSRAAPLFNDAPIGLRERPLAVPLADRLAHAADSNTLFVNFERLRIPTPADVAALRREVEVRLTPIGHRVFGIVNNTTSNLIPMFSLDLRKAHQSVNRGWPRPRPALVLNARLAYRPALSRHRPLRG